MGEGGLGSNARVRRHGRGAPGLLAAADRPGGATGDPAARPATRRRDRRPGGATGDPAARAELWDGLDNLRGSGWGALVTELEGLMAGGAAFRPSPALTAAERVVVERAMAAAAGDGG
jgi:hypothetical protein